MDVNIILRIITFSFLQILWYYWLSLLIMPPCRLCLTPKVLSDIQTVNPTPEWIIQKFRETGPGIHGSQVTPDDPCYEGSSENPVLVEII